ncbi:MAG: hypothetical protein E6447_11130, partial [Bradyrhizobium sp.]|nr:hypothetical protein [Bradyrhizobium sp.]
RGHPLSSAARDKPAGINRLAKGQGFARALDPGFGVTVPAFRPHREAVHSSLSSTVTARSRCHVDGRQWIG